jgi:outer membrane immunogenic protein
MSTKSLLLTSAAVTGLLVGPAAAADLLPVKAPIYKAPPVVVGDPWTGFYVGANVGGAWGHSDATTSVPCDAINSPPGYLCDTTSITTNAAAVAASGTGPLSASGVTGGIQAGYNRQYNNLVVGVEADFGAFSLSGSRAVSALYPATFNVTAGQTYTVGSSFSTDWLFTFRGRIGWATPQWLLYATGGLAVTNLNVANTFSDNNVTAGGAGASGGGSASSDKLGWTIGAGAEFKLDRHWNVKAEYLYLNFGSVTAHGIITNPGFGPGYAQGINTAADLTAHVARVGVNYQF